MFSLLLTVIISYVVVHVCNGSSTSGSLILDSGTNQTVTVHADATSGNVTITISGDSTNWIGVGFGSAAMQDTYAVISDGGATNVDVHEYILGYHTRGIVLVEPFKVLSNTVDNGCRTFQIQRGYKGYYDFPTGPSYIAVVWSFGPSNQPIYNTSTVMQKYGSNTLKMISDSVH